MKKYLIALIILFCCCNPNYYYKTTRKLETTGKLTTHGFYQAQLEGNDEYMIVIFLYENGAFFHIAVPKNDISSRFREYNQILPTYGYGNTGIYYLSGDSIIIERNIITDAFWKNTKTTKNGRILNDTTFVADIYGDRIDTFRFVQHDFKPDSTLFEKYKFIPKLKLE